MIVAFTGPRPQNCGGFVIPNPTYNTIIKSIKTFLNEEKPDEIISGFALGVDLWAAWIAISLNIPVIAAIPFKGQEKLWNAADQEKYNKLLSKAKNVKIISGMSNKKAFLDRNEWMIDNCDLLCAVHGDIPSNGTQHAINYAKSIDRPIKHLLF